MLELYLEVPDTQLLIRSVHSYWLLTESVERAAEQTRALPALSGLPARDRASRSVHWCTSSAY